jgi:hypothetical protein
MSGIRVSDTFICGEEMRFPIDPMERSQVMHVQPAAQGDSFARGPQQRPFNVAMTELVLKYALVGFHRNLSLEPSGSSSPTIARWEA